MTENMCCYLSKYDSFYFIVVFQTEDNEPAAPANVFPLEVVVQRGRQLEGPRETPGSHPGKQTAVFKAKTEGIARYLLLRDSTGG
jgi:hypothetical protein